MRYTSPVPAAHRRFVRPFALLACAALTALATPIGAADDESRSGSLMVGGVTRTFHLYAPQAAAAAATAPLVVVLHGGYGDGLQAERSYHWDQAAQRGGFLVVYPDGNNRAWNGGTCCGAPQRENIDDVAFLSELVRTLVRSDHADPRRVFITGISNGAFMAYRMACEATISIAAIGPVAGTLVAPCPHPKPMSVLAIHGLADRNVPFAGGNGSGEVRDVQSVTASLRVWTAADRCEPPSETRAQPVTTRSWKCANGRTIRLITVDGAGHQWPGGEPPSAVAQGLAGLFGFHLDPPSSALDATATLAAFFAERSASAPR
jgi:polyhydroxybutyrate depolymerase